MVVAGTRPELIKLAPVFWELDRKGIDYVFVWSGQHYDYEMSRVFIEELRLPDPDFDLGVGSGSHAVQTAKVMVGVEEVLRRYDPSLVTALGDTNTVVAAALASVKPLVPFAHIEAGLRSWNEAMPEEVNRRVADHVAQLLLTPSATATVNLLAEGLSLSRVFHVGNTIVDVLQHAIQIAERRGSSLGDSYKPGDKYILVTVHRQENVDNPERLCAIVRALARLAREYTIVLPLHPRTRKRLREHGLLHKLELHENVKIIKPLGYFEFLYLLKNALAVLTDSGGVQEEAFMLRVPTITLRYNTERPETVLLGCNVLAGADENLIVEYTKRMIEIRDLIRSKLSKARNPYGDGKAAQRIVDVIHAYASGEGAIREPDLRETPHIVYVVKRLGEIPNELSDVISYIAEDGSLTSDRAKAVAAYLRSRVRVMKPWESLGFS